MISFYIAQICGLQAKSAQKMAAANSQTIGLNLAACKIKPQRMYSIKTPRKIYGRLRNKLYASAVVFVFFHISRILAIVVYVVFLRIGIIKILGRHS